MEDRCSFEDCSRTERHELEELRGTLSKSTTGLDGTSEPCNDNVETQGDSDIEDATVVASG